VAPITVSIWNPPFYQDCFEYIFPALYGCRDQPTKRKHSGDECNPIVAFGNLKPENHARLPLEAAAEKHTAAENRPQWEPVAAAGIAFSTIGNGQVMALSCFSLAPPLPKIVRLF
jgi:hypothetical protein